MLRETSVQSPIRIYRSPPARFTGMRKGFDNVGAIVQTERELRPFSGYGSCWPQANDGIVHVTSAQRSMLPKEPTGDNRNAGGNRSERRRAEGSMQTTRRLLH